MEFDLQRASVVAGEGIVARFPGVLCVARCPDPEPLRRLIDLCAAASGADPGRTLSRSLARWLASTDDLAESLVFGTVATAGPQLAVFLSGAVAVEVVAERQRLSGTDAAAWTDRLLPMPDSPVVLALHDAATNGPAMAHLGLLDLQGGVVPGAGVVLRPDRGGDPGRSASVRPASAPSPLSSDLDRSPLAPDADRPRGNGSSRPVGPSPAGPISGSAVPGLRAVVEPVEVADPLARPQDRKVERKLAAVPEPRPDAARPDAARPETLAKDERGADDALGVDGPPDEGFSPDEWFAPTSDASGRPPGPGGGAPANGARVWTEPGTGIGGRHAVYDTGGPVDGGAAERPRPSNGAIAASAAGPAVSGDDLPTPTRGDAPVVIAPSPTQAPSWAAPASAPVVTRAEPAPSAAEVTQAPGQSVPAPRSAPRPPRRPEPTVASRNGVADPAVDDGDPTEHGSNGARVPGSGVSLGQLVWDDGARYTLDAEYLVGRMPESDQRVRAGAMRSIIVEDRSGAVSRVHAEIRIEEGAVQLIDSGSRNGTFVAEAGQQGWTPLAPGQSRRLSAGTRVRMGGRTFVFEPATGDAQPRRNENRT